MASSTAKNLVLDFIEDLKRVLVTDGEQGDLLMIKFLFEKMSPESVLQHMIDNVLPHEKKIESRDMDFFLECRGGIFEGLPKDKVNHYASVISDSSVMNDEEREAIWQYLDMFVFLAKSRKNV